jgi:hypothetical protein
VASLSTSATLLDSTASQPARHGGHKPGVQIFTSFAEVQGRDASSVRRSDSFKVCTADAGGPGFVDVVAMSHIRHWRTSEAEAAVCC